MGLMKWTVSLMLIGLFSIAIIGFAVNFANDNSSPIDLADDTELIGARNKVEGNFSTLKTGLTGTPNAIISSSVSSEGFTTESAGAFSITASDLGNVAKNIIEVGYTKIFGGSTSLAVFFTAFMGIISFITGMYIWKAWIGRDPE